MCLWVANFVRAGTSAQRSLLRPWLYPPKWKSKACILTSALTAYWYTFSCFLLQPLHTLSDCACQCMHWHFDNSTRFPCMQMPFSMVLYAMQTDADVHAKWCPLFLSIVWTQAEACGNAGDLSRVYDFQKIVGKTAPVRFSHPNALQLESERKPDQRICATAEDLDLGQQRGSYGVHAMLTLTTLKSRSWYRMLKACCTKVVGFLRLFVTT